MEMKQHHPNYEVHQCPVIARQDMSCGDEIPEERGSQRYPKHCGEVLVQVLMPTA
jgi:predicted RNA-binding Zn-ribbon protein involved in translation (DUF1610 family)